MTIDVSKLNYGMLVGPAGGLVVSKVNYGMLVGPVGGLVISKLNYGVVIDSLFTGTGRRRQIINT